MKEQAPRCAAAFRALDLVTKKVVHTLSGCEAFDAGVTFIQGAPVEVECHNPASSKTLPG